MSENLTQWSYHVLLVLKMIKLSLSNKKSPSAVPRWPADQICHRKTDKKTTIIKKYNHSYYIFCLRFWLVPFSKLFFYLSRNHNYFQKTLKYISSSASVRGRRDGMCARADELAWVCPVWWCDVRDHQSLFVTSWPWTYSIKRLEMTKPSTFYANCRVSLLEVFLRG